MLDIDEMLDANYPKKTLILKNLPDKLFFLEILLLVTAIKLWMEANFVVVCSHISQISNVASISIVIERKKEYTLEI